MLAAPIPASSTDGALITGLLEERRRLFRQQIVETRQTLEGKLNLELERIKASIPRQLLRLTLREFLQLEAVSREEAAASPEKRNTLISLKTSRPLPGYDRTRRVTRSMAAKLQQQEADLMMAAAEDLDALKRQTIVTEAAAVAATEAATPKFHPGLPETPAFLRRRGLPPKNQSGILPPEPDSSAASARKRGRPRASQSGIFEESSMRSSLAAGRKRGRPRKETSSNIFVDPLLRPSMATRATIRSSLIKADGETRRSTVTSTAGIMSVELQDGKLLDVDITESPSKVVASLGVEAVREMKAKMQAYAAQLKSFFRRLKVHET